MIQSRNLFYKKTYKHRLSCNKAFHRLGWKSGENYRNVWVCNGRHKTKGVMGYSNRHVDDEVLKKVTMTAWNEIIKNRDNFMAQRDKITEGENVLNAYKAKLMKRLIEEKEISNEFDLDLVLACLDHIRVYESGNLVVRFCDGTEFECQAKLKDIILP